MTPNAAPAWPVLSQSERRIIGVLVEKQKTTDTYPLTINSILTGCNQKSNREPLLNLDEGTVEDTLAELQKKGLIMRVVSGRVDKWRHLLYETWKVSSVELAILAELLLRGPQTEGELRGRAARMDDIADVDTLRTLLKPLAERKLVIYLTAEGRRGTVVTHGFHDPQEIERLRAAASSGAWEEPSTTAANPPAPGFDSQSLLARLATAEANIQSLRDEIGQLTVVVDRLRKELGVGGAP